ncbi:MAG: hypothetical protein LBD80_08045 [Tannerella sp.]|jgi:hypothetical protein|nr:hypothetical protein [Tannerella sp.]
MQQSWSRPMTVQRIVFVMDFHHRKPAIDLSFQHISQDMSKRLDDVRKAIVKLSYTVENHTVSGE